MLLTVQGQGLYKRITFAPHPGAPIHKAHQTYMASDVPFSIIIQH